MKQDREHRHYSRKATTFRVDYARDPAGDSIGYTAWGIARNLSPGGMFVEHSPDIAVGETITTAFVLPTGRPVKLPARVVHEATNGSGLEFIKGHTLSHLVGIRELRAYCVA